MSMTDNLCKEPYLRIVKRQISVSVLRWVCCWILCKELYLRIVKGQISVSGLRWVCCWILLAIPATAFSWPATLNCAWQLPNLTCAVKPLVPVQIQHAELKVDSQTHRLMTHWQPFVDSSKKRAILWLVDISDPARAGTVKKQQQLLQSWLPQLTDARYQLGLAAFADNLRTLAPLNSEPAVLTQALKALSAQGYSTAFYQSLLNSLELLKWTQAERKSLWIFSDGMAEDTAYQHEDVVLAAREANVMIVGLGYPERKSQRPQLQRLQRLAEETGGYFVTAREGQLPVNSLKDILALVDGGGTLSLDLPDLYGLHQASLTVWDTSGEMFAKTFPIQGLSLPPIEIADPATKGKQERLSTQFTPVLSTGSPSPLTVPGPSIDWRWMTVGIVLLVLILLILLIVAIWRLSMRKKFSSHAILARLENLHSGQLMMITAPFCRIGRAPDNELYFKNDSVSAYHAELHHHRDGAFEIADIGSTNGVWINGRRVKKQGLRNGDVVELGEIRLRFWEVPQ